jgi:DNA polymerase III subunit epsilon
MGLLRNEIFVCVDCETTGLDTENDLIVEVGAVRFTLEETLDSYTTLVNPGQPISPESQAIHKITDEMVADAPPMTEVLTPLLAFLKEGVIIGHNIPFDLAMIDNAAKRLGRETTLLARPQMDTLRLARLYGESPVNSLEGLRRHFHISPEAAHRALDDAKVNALVFNRLVERFKTTEDVFKALSKPIRMRHMPLGKHKGRSFSEVPVNYLRWASHQNFDRDLLYSIKYELKRRQSGTHFGATTNPFQNL